VVRLTEYDSKKWCL